MLIISPKILRAERLNGQRGLGNIMWIHEGLDKIPSGSLLSPFFFLSFHLNNIKLLFYHNCILTIYSFICLLCCAKSMGYGNCTIFSGMSLKSSYTTGMRACRKSITFLVKRCTFQAFSGNSAHLSE